MRLQITVVLGTFKVRTSVLWHLAFLFNIYCWELCLLFAHKVQSLFYPGHYSLVMAVKELFVEQTVDYY